MHKIVHDDKPLSWDHHVRNVEVTIDHNGDVMIPMQKDQLLLSKNHKECVKQLREFGQAEYVGPHCRLTCQQRNIVLKSLRLERFADGGKPAFGECSGNQRDAYMAKQKGLGQ